jgi:RND family efflux transporter MFP subunit
MKKGMILVALVLSACAPKTADKNLEELVAKRDSLQVAQIKTEKELNKIALEIAALDSTVNPDDMDIVKQITIQKNRIAATQLKIKKLENKMTQAPKNNLTPVEIKEMRGEKFNHYIIVYGKVEADNYALISPEMPGRIETIHVREGQEVKQGKLLLSLNTEAIDKQIQGIQSSLDLAKTTFEKQDTLWKQGIGSEIQYLSSKNSMESLEAQMEALLAQKRMAQIRAPFSGIVDKIFLKEGELASSMMPVVEFVNLKKLTIKADISENYIDQLHVGQTVEVSFSSLPEVKISAPIKRKAKVINSISRTFEIELNFKNIGDRIKPNMVSTISIKDYSSSNAFVIPSLAIMKDITGSYIYLAVEKDDKPIVKKQYITTGKSYQDNSEVVKGLNEGNQVVVKGYHLVSAGLPVKIVNQD